MKETFSPNTMLSHYRILSKLGAGGMGEVYLAEDTKLDRKVALKLLPAEFTQDADRVRRFVQEAKAASTLNHPNIITVYDIGESEAGRFIVMELVAGRTLRAVIAADNSVETLWSVGSQMAKALSAAHAAGITHRDIKPDNIMVRPDGYVKILDFGLARLLPTTASDSEAATVSGTTPGMLLGTVAYMSPEQARGEAASHPSDIFALGIVLYELSTGRHPFKADTLVGYLHAITLQTPPSLTSLKRELPAALDALILRMLEKDASQRPTASEVAQALQEMERHGAGYTPSLVPQTSGAARADEGFWVAVLPFKWRGANAELEALAEGLTEDIVTGLSRFSYLRVIARGSTLSYASDSGDLRAVGKELGARYIMEGSLRQAGSTLRVAVQLVDGSTGTHLWAETYNRTFSPEAVFELQDELVPRIVSTCADWYGVLPHSMSEAVRLKPPDQLSPYEAVLRSFGYFERIAPEEHAAVRAGLERAVEQAPGNADGWAMLSMMYGEEHRFSFNVQPDPLGRSLQAARRAVDAAHANHFAWLALAQALFFRKEFDAFRDAAERAIAINPMDGSTLEYLGHLIAFAGDWERGYDVAERARQMNPNHPGWYWAVPFLDAYRKGDYQTARPYLLKALMRGGGAQLFNQALLAALYGQLGEPEEANKTLQTVLAAKPDFPLTVRGEFEKWYLPELTEHLLDGLRKAGLEIAGEEGISTPSPATETRATPESSIAVLPFANISADEENEYFCDGLAEELLNMLSKIGALRVAARTSSFSFKGKDTDIREIGQKLNVGAVLEGSVRKLGRRLRITAQLVKVADGYQLWSEKYDRELEDIFDIQDEISLAIVAALKVKLLGAEKEAVVKRYTDNIEAYQLYLQGRFHINKFTEEGFRKALEYYEQALALEPDYAPAFAGIAYVYVLLSFMGAMAPDEAVPHIRAALAKALALDQTLSESHFSLALLKYTYEWDLEGAEKEFKQALALNPNNVQAIRGYGFLLTLYGRRDEAVAQAAQALELDPLSLLNNSHVGMIFFCADEYERLLAQGRTLVALEPRFHGGHWLIGLEAMSRKDYDQALPALEAAATLGGPLASYLLGCLYGILGQRETAHRLLDELQQLSAQRYVSQTGFAWIYAGLGEMDRAFEWLERAYEQREGNLIYLKQIAALIPGLSADPRLTDLLRRIGLPTEEQLQPDESLEANRMTLAPSGQQAADVFVASASLRHTVGRAAERNELRAAFKVAKDGRGSLLCVAGEPGIGKTTLVEDFLAELAADQQSTIARGRCSERLAGTEAYLPLLEALENLLQSNKDLAPRMKQLAPTWYAQVAPLSGESAESARLLAEIKAASQERMKRELASFLQSVAALQPLVIFFDDLHWADVSTIDLLSFLAGKFDALRVLIVVTYRPSDMLLAKHPFLQIKPDLQARGLCREWLLEFLTEAEIAEYLALEFPRHRFPPEFPKLIHAKTEGSPLFMADLVRYLRDRGVIAQSSGGWTLAQTLPDIERELPESVRGMIERKIAQLGEEDRKLLIAASVEGYEFDSAVVAQVLKLEADEVEERLEKLERVFAFVKLVSEAEFPNRTLTLKYRFVHVLYQNALYASLRVTRKAALSTAVAQTLEDFYGEKKASVVGELAALYETGREFAKAADYFHLAAEHASQLFAAQEAAALAGRGIAVLKSLPETRQRHQQELALQVALGVALRTSKGFSNPETGEAYARARELCQQIGDASQLFSVLFGLWEFYQSTGQFETGLELGEQMLSAAGQDPALRLVAHNVMGDQLTWAGNFVAAREHLEKGIALYDSDQHRSHVFLYGYDSGVACLCFESIVLWHLGYPDQALKQSVEAGDLAAKLSHPVNLAFAASFAAWFHSLIGSAPAAQEQAETAIAISEQYEIAMFLAWGKLMKGWALIAQGKIKEGITLASQGTNEWRATGTLIATTWCLGILAEGEAKAGLTEDALALLAEALDFASKAGEHFYEAELHRLHGELQLKSNDSHLAPAAESSYLQAIEIAQEQSAKSLELRAVMSLARLWQGQGRIAEARQMLAEIYGWFTEGFDTTDLKEAKALLNELQQQATGVRTGSVSDSPPESRISPPESRLLPLQEARDSEASGRSRSPYHTEASASIAVLPFVNMSNDPDNEYFCDGLAEELLNALSKIEALHVAARTSAFFFKGKEADIREIGQKLNVTTVLEGSVRKAGNRLRITAQLVNVADGYHLWSEKYDRQMEDIFDIQDEISLAIVDALKVKLLGAEKAVVLKRATNNPEAYELYLKGRYFWFKANPEGWIKARECFEKALEKDPHFALALTGLADALSVSAVFTPSHEVFPKAKEMALRALKLDTSMAEAWCSRAAVKFFYEWDWAGAESDCRHAMDLNPRYVLVHDLYSLCLLTQARFEEAISEARRACELDPLSAYINASLGLSLYFSHRYDEATAQLLKGAELDAGQIWSQMWLVDLYEQRGLHGEALHHRQKLLTLTGNNELAIEIGQEFQRSGAQGVWLKCLAALHEQSQFRYVSPLDFAALYVRLGEQEKALDWLEKAYSERAIYLNFLKVRPTWESLHSNPRYAHLLRRIGLP